MRVGLCVVLGFCLAAMSAGCGDDSGSTNNNNDNSNQNNNVVAECGNGDVEGLEECDDGTANSDTEPNACRSGCTLPVCGDSVVDDGSGETCDDGDDNSDTEPDACRSTCVEAACGDGVIDTYRGETCDDGNTATGDGCGADCVLESCGDGILDTGEDCDDGVNNSDTEADACRLNCTLARCGDSTVDTDEVCDDGNVNDGDGCDGDCLSDETCGNLIVDINEECDDGNFASRDGCSSGCTTETLQWQSIGGGQLPPRARCGHTMAYDSGRRVIVLHGGNQTTSGGLLLDTTSELDQHWWADPNPNPNITAPRKWTAMAYDPANERMHLFGGFSPHGGTFIVLSEDDNWYFEGTFWEFRNYSILPDPRYGHTMVYDTARSKAMLFGGENSSTQFNDTHEATDAGMLTVWSDVSPAQSPDARAFHAMTYDEDRQVAVLYGGIAGTMFSNETWEYDGVANTWTDVSPAPGNPNPGSRAHFAMAYDQNRQRVVLFAGRNLNTVFGDTWEWDGSSWVETTPAGSPTARHSHAMAYDPGRRAVVLYGGMGSTDDCNGASTHGRLDTWIYRYGSAWPDEVCDSGADDDADGLVDCADPDCEGQLCATGTCTGGSCQ